MLDDVGIIHMNWRIYDPEIGRMSSPDPIIQAPDNTQSDNAYCYVMNNPMRFTDPSGYSWFGDLFKSIGKFFKKKIRWVKKNWKTVVTVVVAVVLIVVTYGAATGWVMGGQMTFWGAVGFGAVSGAGIAVAQAAIAGGSWSDIGKDSLCSRERCRRRLERGDWRELQRWLYRRSGWGYAESGEWLREQEPRVW
jgi:RHS repeat-associated protein